MSSQGIAKKGLDIVKKAAPVAGETALAALEAGGAAGGSAALIAAQKAAQISTDAAQIANVAFMTHNTLNGIMLEQFAAVMETLLKTSKLGAKTLTKSVPEGF